MPSFLTEIKNRCKVTPKRCQEYATHSPSTYQMLQILEVGLSSRLRILNGVLHAKLLFEVADG